MTYDTLQIDQCRDECRQFLHAKRAVLSATYDIESNEWNDVGDGS